MRVVKKAAASRLMLLLLMSAGVLPCAAETLEERLPTCLACHGEHGISINPEVPSLGGQPAPYMEIQLYLFRERMRSIDVMNDAMKGISDEDLRKLGKLLSTLPPPAPAEPGDPVRMEHGQALVHKHRCNFCHSADLSGQNSVPRIAGQREDYLLKALREYKNNTRPGYDASMAEVVQPLTEDDIRELAYYAARQR
jgi:cytochrome c553